MSLDEIITKKITCPCGKGIIYKALYMDDWNRIIDETVHIECEDCKKTYKVEFEYVKSNKPGRGDYNIYYLTPINYPPYSGISENSIYGVLHNNTNEISFSDYLIENYSLIDLEKAKEEYGIKHSSSKVTGIAKELCKKHKRFSNSVKTDSVVEKLELAIKQYKSYSGSYDQRIIIREQENIAKKDYLLNKRKFQIKLEL